ncbi:AAA family ATPase [Pseudoalteromonas ruthenica]|uniref:AAA family ATPase n=1 Tax=Pseudoalteromonas ruthenica TaxID=151081 RepID=UPI00110A4A1A|nr:AAA family ATPase [Pseudoalteromonas ruthenica]TMO85506.1 hypothetical protein CWC12_16685 [Pseudoalteromonas ruthenica]TMP22810.1 hypothetical protein CWC06_13460 [Pseudoalteromonas ruthenica]USN27131.1 hypothetical protein [synthetic construct]
MELVFVHIDEFKGVKDILLELHSGFSCCKRDNLIKVEKADNTKNHHYYLNNNVKLILGKNGVGKTTILEFIESLFNNINQTSAYGTALFHDGFKFHRITTSRWLKISADADIEDIDKPQRTALLYVDNIFDIKKYAFGQIEKKSENTLKLTDNTILSKKLGKRKILRNELKREFDLVQSNYFSSMKASFGIEVNYRFKVYKSSIRRFREYLSKLEQNLFKDLIHDPSLASRIKAYSKGDNTLLKNTSSLQEIYNENVLTENRKKEIRKHIEHALCGFVQKELLTIELPKYAEDNYLAFISIFVPELSHKYSTGLKNEQERMFFYCYSILNFTLGEKEHIEEIFVESLRKVPFDEDVSDRISSCSKIVDTLERMSSLCFENSIKVKSDSEGLYFDLTSEVQVYSLSPLIEYIMDDVSDNISYGWHGLSSGELAKLKLYSRVYDGARQLIRKEVDTVLIVIDEIDTYLHPEWQRRTLKELLGIINSLKSYRNGSSKFQLILTSHSPIVMSDFLKHDIISLSKNNGYLEIEKASGFGTVISHLYLDGMHLESTFGELARESIDDLFLARNKNKINSYHRYLINQIPDEDIQKMFLNSDD